MDAIQRIRRGCRKRGVKALVPYLYASFVRSRLPKSRTVVRYNGIESPVPVCPLDRVVPFYDPPWYTSDVPNYEDAEIGAIRTHCRRGDEVVIVGGGFGVTAVVAGRLVGPEGRVVVYEASRRGLRRTAGTIAHNGVEDRVTLEHAVVGEAVDPKGSTDGAEVLAPRELPDADVYEIDCEGAELAVLEGMEATPDTVVVEAHAHLGAPRADVEDALVEHGYEIAETVDKDLEGLAVLVGTRPD